MLDTNRSGGALAAFPPPHTFFFTREKDTNLGYVWYRKDAEGRFGIGVGLIVASSAVVLVESKQRASNVPTVRVLCSQV